MSPAVPLVSTALMLVIVPARALVDPAGVTVTFWPFLTSVRVASGNSKLTWALPLPTMVIAPALDAEPFDSSTVPTVPAMGASSSALSRSSCAACSACSACSSLALADATWAALTVAVVVDELLDEPDLVLDEPDVVLDDPVPLWPPVPPLPDGCTNCCTTVCRFAVASLTCARASPHALSSASVGSLASMIASWSSTVADGLADGDSLSVGVGSADGLAVSVVVSDGLGLADGLSLVDGDGLAVGSGTAPNTGSQATSSAATAVVSAVVAASRGAGLMVTPPCAPDPLPPEPLEPEPLEPEPLELELEPDEPVRLLVLVGFCAEYRFALASATDVSASSTANCSGPFLSTASTSPAST